MTDGVLLVIAILFWSVAFDAIAYRWPNIGHLIKARPRPLIENGRINPQVLKREFMTREEVMSQLRLHGIEDPAEIERACLEPNGMISVIRRDRQEPDEPVWPETAL